MFKDLFTRLPVILLEPVALALKGVGGQGELAARPGMVD
jgi:hypothetical protein